MTDRVPGAPGQYSAKISAEELLKMQAGEAFTITLARDDQPITEGTPYSKAAVLPDELAQALCPGINDPTPADAFYALYAKAIESTDYPGCYYRMVDNEMEWINPPMIADTVYRTTKRFYGHPVYTVAVVFSALAPAGTSVYKKFPDGTISKVANMTTTYYPHILGLAMSGDPFMDHDGLYAKAEITVDDVVQQISIRSNSDVATGFSAVCVVEFTKA